MAALAVLRPRMAECLRAREIVLGFYYDEVTLDVLPKQRQQLA